MPVLSARLAVVGGVVFVANAGLLVLQLVAGPLLSPFIGSSLETWTSVIAAFLIGIAAGNFFGGRIADRSPRFRTLGLFLLLGAVAAAWMVAFPSAIGGGAYKALPLGPRIPVLALGLCLPVAFVLSLLTPLAIRIAVPDAASTGRVAGLVFALSTLGCLLGNYLTGFVLIPEFTLNTIVFGVAGALAALAAVVLLLKVPMTGPTDAVDDGQPDGPAAMALPLGFAIVFLCSFAGMTLELSATRLMAQVVGSSIYTWTGVIGVMLLGTACGNWLGGRLAGRGANALGVTLVVAGLAGVLVVILYCLMPRLASASPEFEEVANKISGLPLRERIVAYTFGLFFLPMAALGMVSPQVIRLCTTGLLTAGRTAGRVYAVSTAGAILGTFATGYVVISGLGVVNAILLAGMVPALAMLLVAGPRGPGVRWKPLAADSGLLLYSMSVVLGAALGGFILGGSMKHYETTDRFKDVVAETNYYTILIETPKPTQAHVPPSDPLAALVGGAAFDVKTQKLVELKSPVRNLYLDHLLHSTVDLEDPTYFRYRHEVIQAEMLRLRADAKPAGQNVLVIGGGGYTFPRAVRTTMPAAAVDVVEIDPGVTRVAKSHLGLKADWGIRTEHMDGRQFVSEKAEKGHYDLVTLDAVNDFSVPSHLLTRECNEAVKATLAPGGIYLVTVIDYPAGGLLWKAAYRTLKQTYAHVELMYPRSDLDGHRDETINNLRNYDELNDEKKRSLDQFLVKLRGSKAEDKTPESDPSQRQAAIEQMRAMTPEEVFGTLDRSVLVMYAADTPLNQAALRRAVGHQTTETSDTYVVPAATVEELLRTGKAVTLSDQYAPTDDLMRRVFSSGR